MLDGPRTQTTPADEPADEAGRGPEPGSWPRRAREHATVPLVAGRIERSSTTEGPLGVAFTMLLWLFVVSRVMVALAMLNVALAQARRPIPEEVLHA